VIPLRKTLSLVCLLACVACLVAGYALVGQWITLAAILLTFPVWLLARRWPSTWLPSTALVISIGLAAAGLMAGASPLLMILSATFALASWDQVLLDHTLTDRSSSAKTIVLFENRHYRSLAVALGLGLLIAVTGRMIRFQIPLGVMIILVIVVLFSLDRIWRTLVD
jgi:hypothetical protein